MPVLMLGDDDEEREIAFEVDFLLSLTTEQRYKMMTERSNHIKKTMIRHGHTNPVEIIKRK